MPTNPQWNCSRVADFLAELEELCKRYDLDVGGVGDALADHIENCDACNRATEELEDRLKLFT